MTRDGWPITERHEAICRELTRAAARGDRADFDAVWQRAHIDADVVTRANVILLDRALILYHYGYRALFRRRASDRILARRLRRVAPVFEDMIDVASARAILSFGHPTEVRNTPAIAQTAALIGATVIGTVHEWEERFDHRVRRVRRRGVGARQWFIDGEGPPATR